MKRSGSPENDGIDRDSILDGGMDRRTLVAGAAGIVISSLAGCSGNNDQEPSGNGNSSAGETGATDDQSVSNDTQQEEYPTAEPQSDVEQDVISGIEDNQSEYGVKIEDFDYINQDDLDPQGRVIPTYSGALNEAITPELDGDDSLWIIFTKPTSGRIEFLRNAERSFSEYANNPPNTVTGASEEFDEEARGAGGADPELAKSEYGEFISERLDGDGVVNHAGEIPEYAHEALESGWQA